jgi:hypothetical protein
VPRPDPIGCIGAASGLTGLTIIYKGHTRVMAGRRFVGFVGKIYVLAVLGL